MTALCIGFENVGNSGGGVMMLLKEAVPFLRAQRYRGGKAGKLSGVQEACEIKAINFKTI